MARVWLRDGFCRKRGVCLSPAFAGIAELPDSRSLVVEDEAEVLKLLAREPDIGDPADMARPRQGGEISLFEFLMKGFADPGNGFACAGRAACGIKNFG